MLDGGKRGKESIMKKIALLSLAMIVLVLSACSPPQVPNDETGISSTVLSSETSVIWPTYLPEDIVLTFDEEFLPHSEWPEVPKYRICYYSNELINAGHNPENTEELSELMAEKYYGIELTDMEEMILVTVIKRFNIPKERIIEAIEESKQGVIELFEDEIDKIDFDVEGREYPNPGIIYTFDNEIINAYYRRENPVVPEEYFSFESYEEFLTFEAHKKANS